MLAVDIDPFMDNTGLGINEYGHSGKGVQNNKRSRSIKRQIHG